MFDAFFIVILASFCAGMASSLSLETRALQTVPAPEILRFLFSPAFAMPVGIITGILAWIILGAVLHGFSKILGGKGSYKHTLLVYGFSEVPAIYLIVFGLLSWFLASELPYSLGSILLGVWSLILLILGLREAQKFSVLRAILALILPIVIIIAVLILIMVVILIPLSV